MWATRVWLELKKHGQLGGLSPGNYSEPFYEMSGCELLFEFSEFYLFSFPAFLRYDFIQSEVSQKEKNKYRILMRMCGI